MWKRLTYMYIFIHAYTYTAMHWLAQTPPVEFGKFALLLV